MIPTTLYAILPAKVVLVLTGSASLLALFQTSTSVPDLSFIGQMERLGLVGVLISAVWILWRKLDTKDTAFIESQTKMIEVLSANAILFKELITKMDRLEEAIDRSVTARNSVEDYRSKHKS